MRLVFSRFTDRGFCAGFLLAILVGSAGISATELTPIDRSIVSDPTRPGGYQQGSGAATAVNEQKSYILSSIVYGGSRARAVINGRFYQQGDSVDGAKVVEIRRDAVLIKDEFGSQVLRWKPAVSLKSE